MFYIKTMFNELVNLEHATLIEITPSLKQGSYEVWAEFTPDTMERLHAGTKEQCQSALDEIFLRMRMHNPGDAFGIMSPGEGDGQDEQHS